MKKKNRKVDKVVEFAQPATVAKQFRNDQPISNEVRDEMLGVFRDFAVYVFERHYADFYPMLAEYIEDHQVKEEKQLALEQNLFWWQFLYKTSQDPEMSCVEGFIAENHHKLNEKPLIISWLREWDKAVPKFYHVGYKYNDRVLVVIDMLAVEALDVIVYDPTATPPKQGEIVMGTLIPIGDALYFPIIDFYHFDFAARGDIARHLNDQYHEQLKTSPIHEAFIYLLSDALQIERFVSLENQENTSLK